MVSHSAFAADRRTLLSGLGATALLSPFLAIERAAASVAGADPRQRAERGHAALAAVPGITIRGSEKVSMLLYPGFTALDLVGPHYFFACMIGANVELVTTEAGLEPVASDLGLAIAPTVTMANAHAAPDIMFVPGGTSGTVACMNRADVTGWIAERGARARYTTSVCTGSLLLGKAGLLKGKRATSHWSVRDLLPLFGATPAEERVVSDGRIVTGAGVSAGLDFGITLLAALRGRPYAEAVMLQCEYAPEPPFPGGTVASTAPALAEPLSDIFAPFVAKAQAAATS